MNELVYKEAGGLESISYGGKSFGIKISIASDYELTEEDHNWLFCQCQDIMKHLNKEADKRNLEVNEAIKKEKEELMRCFELKETVYVRSIPNEYDPTSLHPWYIVVTHRGPIKIGWRHRVINIDWSESIIPAKSEDLFSNEEVTKEDKYIHAWSYEKAKEYITKLLES